MEVIKQLCEYIESFVDTVNRLMDYTRQQKDYMVKIQKIYEENKEIIKIAHMNKLADGVYYNDNYNVVYVKHDSVISKYQLVETVFDMSKMEENTK